MAENIVQKKTDEKIRNKQINYIIIEKLWTHVTEKPKSELYKKLGINKNTYSKIRQGKTHHYSTREKYARSNLSSLGLPVDIMTGEQIIEIEGLTVQIWDEYLEYRNKKETSPQKTKILSTMNQRLKEAFQKLTPNKKNKQPLDILYLYFKENKLLNIDISDREMRDLYDSLSKITLEMIINCEGKLQKDVFDEIREKYEWMDTVIKYGKLFEQ